jgi:S1-C subfamily serine protease
MRGTARRLAPGLVLAATAALLALAAPEARAGGALEGFEDAFRRAVQRATAATVVVVPARVERGEEPGHSSGVLVSSDGLVLSDGDAGLVTRRRGEAEERARSDHVIVRVAAPSGGHVNHPATVLSRDLNADTSLLRIESPPAGGFEPLVPGSSRTLEVGHFVFVAGSSVDVPDGVAPAVTSGILAARRPAAAGASGGGDAFLFVTAAVNPGANGGALLDLHGRLVGTVSTYVSPGSADEPFQFLGKAVPVDRIRAVHARVPGAEAVFARAGEDAPPAPESALALQRTFRRAGARAAPWVVSLQVERASPLSSRGPLGREVLSPERHPGPVSGVLVSPSGWIVTSLYNVTNVATLVEPLWKPPAGASLTAGWQALEGVVAHFRDGPSVPARFVAYDPRLGIALAKADLSRAPEFRPTLFDPAPADAYREGRFVLAVGNPYGARPPTDPFLSHGILSKRHPDDAVAPWRGQWQTDVGATDANAGGAVVDLEGRLVGMLTIWSGVQHGRNSGIAFVVPWGRIQRALPALQQGRIPSPGRLGIRFAPGPAPRVSDVVPGSAADTAGVRAGDVIVRVDRERVFTTAEVLNALGFRWAGDRVVLRVERTTGAKDLTAVLESGGPPR